MNLLLGQIMPDWTLTGQDGAARRISDWRGRENLVVFVVRRRTLDWTARLMNELYARHTELDWEKASVIAVADDPSALAALRARLPQRSFPLYQIKTPPSDVCVIVLDRFGEIYSIVEQPEVTTDDLLDTIRFIELQCPE